MSGNGDSYPRRVLVVGSGSIASRHLTVLSSFGLTEADVFSRSGRELVVDGVRTRSVSLDSSGKEDYDLVVICSKTQEHSRDLGDLVARGKTIVIEKPLAGSLEDLDIIEDLGEAGTRVVVSFPLRFKEALGSLFRILRDSGGSQIHAHAECRSWLPSWRPDREARDGYWNEPGSGGVALELIHEFDYLDLLWGPLRLRSIEDTSQGILGLQVAESIDAIGNGGHGQSVSLHLDFCSRVSTRTVSFDLGETIWTWDVIHSTLTKQSGDTRAIEHFPADEDRNTSFRRQYEEIFRPGSQPLPACSVKQALRLNREVLRAMEVSHGG